MLRRSRNSTTRIARPIAASAAATVRMKNTNIWPLMSPQIARERDKIEIDREQHELDAHQQDDDVLAVQEHAGNRDGKQNARQHEHVSESNHGLFSEAILTIRTRSFARTATCCAMSCGL